MASSTKFSISFCNLADEYSYRQPLNCHYVISGASTNDLLKLTKDDWIGLYKVGWRTTQDCILFQKHTIPDSPESSGQVTCSVSFAADSLPRDSTEFYQLCYVKASDGSVVPSTPFQLKESIGSNSGGFIEIDDGSSLVIIDRTSTSIGASPHHDVVVSQKQDDAMTSTGSSLGDAGHESELDKLKAKVEEQQTRLDEQVNALAEKDDEIAKIKRELATKDEELRTRMDENTRVQNELLNIHAALEQEKKTARDKEATHAGQIENLRQELITMAMDKQLPASPAAAAASTAEVAVGDSSAAANVVSTSTNTSLEMLSRMTESLRGVLQSGAAAAPPNCPYNLSCPYSCGQIFSPDTPEEEIMEHIRSAHDESSKEKLCPVCSHKFDENVSQDIIEVHVNQCLDNNTTNPPIGGGIAI